MAGGSANLKVCDSILKLSYASNIELLRAQIHSGDDGGAQLNHSVAHHDAQ